MNGVQTKAHSNQSEPNSDAGPDETPTYNCNTHSNAYLQLTQFLPAEYYIVHDCVESNRKEDFDRLADGSITYSSLENEPTYRICVEQANHQGYSKLRCVDDYNQGPQSFSPH